MKTNAMRILDKKGIDYKSYEYKTDGAVSGTVVAEMIGHPYEQVFKTLVTVAHSKQHYVFVIPVAKELNLKKAATAAHEKSIDMVKSKELLGLTGYVHGGCSPIGMKKPFPTFVDQSAAGQDTIIFSGGHIGCQVEMSPGQLGEVVAYTLADLCDE